MPTVKFSPKSWKNVKLKPNSPLKAVDLDRTKTNPYIDHLCFVKNSWSSLISKRNFNREVSLETCYQLLESWELNWSQLISSRRKLKRTPGIFDTVDILKCQLLWVYTFVPFQERQICERAGLFTDQLNPLMGSLTEFPERSSKQLTPTPTPAHSPQVKQKSVEKQVYIPLGRSPRLPKVFAELRPWEGWTWCHSPYLLIVRPQALDAWSCDALACRPVCCYQLVMIVQKVGNVKLTNTVSKKKLKKKYANVFWCVLTCVKRPCYWQVVSSIHLVVLNFQV